jgi:peptidoglycan-associated lipoprotein
MSNLLRISSRVALVVAVLALAACGQGRMGAGDTTNLNGNGMAGATDPSSPAFFNQTIGDRVLFAVDQSTLASEGRATLDGQAQWLLTNGEYAALIEGHADEQGTREYNLALGARRAAAVQEYLISRGVPANRLRTISYGKERPLEICSDETCYRQNRRAVSVISVGAGV